MKYQETFDRLGNPVAKPADRDGWFIILGCIAAVVIVSLWLRN